jgi:hypothetical protein
MGLSRETHYFGSAESRHFTLSALRDFGDERKRKSIKAAMRITARRLRLKPLAPQKIGPPCGELLNPKKAQA